MVAVELELRRIDEVRHRWDVSSVARRGGAPPGAVVALLERRTVLGQHRDALLASMAALRVVPATEPAPASAWQQLRAAQETLRNLAAGRNALGDPVEATVLRLAIDEGASARSFLNRVVARDPGAATSSGPVADTATVEFAEFSGATERSAAAAPAPESTGTTNQTPTTSSAGSVSGAVVRALPLADAATADPGEPSTDDLDQNDPGGLDDGAPVPEVTPPSEHTTTSTLGSTSSRPASRHTAPIGTMLTFERQPSDESASERDPEQASDLSSEPTAETAVEEATSSTARVAADPDPHSPTDTS